MKKIEKSIVSISPTYSAQQVYLLGTFNPDGTLFLQSQAFVCYIPGPPEGNILGIVASEQMKSNILREQTFSLNLCNVDMLSVVDSAWQGYMPEVSGEKNIGYKNGVKLNVPILDASPCVEECKVVQSFHVGDTFVVISETICTHAEHKNILPYDGSEDLYNWYTRQDAQQFNPLMYSVKYYTLGKSVGQLGKNNW